MHNRTLSVDGLRINVTEWGSGPPVVLVHGLTGSLDYWAPFAERLARRRRVIAFDVPGHGGSDPLETFSFDALVDVLAGACEQLEVDRPAVVGHSFGVPIALCWAAAHSVSALVLASPVGMTPLSIGKARTVMPVRKVLARSERLWEAAAVRSQAAAQSGVRVVRRHAPGWRTWSRRWPARTAARGGQGGAGGVFGPARPGDARPGGRAGRTVQVRSLVVWGEHDRSGWDNGPALQADALGAQELVLPGVGHMPMIEAPYSFGQAVSRSSSASARGGSGPAKLVAARPRKPVDG